MQVDSKFSGFKKRSKSAKKAIMEPVTDQSMKEFLDSIPESKYLSKRTIQRKNASVLTEHKCDCGTMFSL